MKLIIMIFNGFYDKKYFAFTLSFIDVWDVASLHIAVFTNKQILEIVISNSQVSLGCQTQKLNGRNGINTKEWVKKNYENSHIYKVILYVYVYFMSLLRNKN